MTDAERLIVAIAAPLADLSFALNALVVLLKKKNIIDTAEFDAITSPTNYESLSSLIAQYQHLLSDVYSATAISEVNTSETDWRYQE